MHKLFVNQVLNERNQFCSSVCVFFFLSFFFVVFSDQTSLILPRFSMAEVKRTKGRAENTQRATIANALLTSAQVTANNFLVVLRRGRMMVKTVKERLSIPRVIVASRPSSSRQPDAGRGPVVPAGRFRRSYFSRGPGKKV